MNHSPPSTPEEPAIVEVHPDDEPLQVPATPAQVRTAQRQDGADDKFPLVALGGSAGSLQAFEDFFRHMRPDSGMAFVVITHLSPSLPSEMAAVLQHFTRMPVQEATDGLRVRPNHVYVIPPNSDMGILHGTLLLFAPPQQDGRRLPIDYFFQSMAKDVRERAVCIICSGMGSDGTIGLKVVMENFGMVMVQSPETAEYDPMPRSAVATEFVDYVLPAAELPAKLLEYVAKPLLARPRREVAESESMPAHALQKIFSLIRSQTGHDFSYYKRNTVFRRIERRMNAHQIAQFTQYVRYLQEHPAEVEALFKELLIGVTKFFRDQAAFDSLKAQLLPMLRAKPADTAIRVWTPGCSTGEEAYSLAMCLFECLDELGDGRRLNIQIFATDINQEGIDFARAGVYPEPISADVSPARLTRFFTTLDGHYQIKKQVRDVVIFAVHNLTKDAPFTKLDLLVCRNLLIYLSAELQKNIIPVFHYALNPGGLLFLGPSENLNGFQDLFAPLDVKWKILQRREGPSALSRISSFHFSHTPPASKAPANGTMQLNSTPKEGTFATLVQRVLLRKYTPPAVVINPKGDILYVNGRTGRYLEPAPGPSSMNVFEMVREELHYEISAAVHKAATTHEDVVAENVRVKTDLGLQLLRITVKCLDEPEQLAGLLLLVFEELPTPRKVRLGRAVLGSELSRDAVVANLEKELQFTKQRLQSTIEEMESSVEELKSTNEELQSANEELQSTNEEAMTNKEEMQSLNEELMTLNMQYLSKTEELSLAANDMRNLLDATEIATIFLDNDMIIKRFTPRINRIISLQSTDVGRPITHFASTLRHESLAQDVKQVLDRLVSQETNIQTLTGEWYAMRILPYRTLDNYISGAVITFTDITGLKNLEAQLQESSRLAETVVETVREPLLVLDYQLRVLAVSQTFAELFGLSGAGAKGRSLTELDNGTWQQPQLRQRLESIIQTPGASFDDFSLKGTFPGVGTRELLVYGRCIPGERASSTKLLLGVRDVTPAAQ